MPRGRTIQPNEVERWLGILLDAVFDPTSKVVDLYTAAEQANASARAQGGEGLLSAQVGRSELLEIAVRFNDEPHMATSQKVDMLLVWINRWMTRKDWERLSARIRRRRFDEGRSRH